MKPLHLLALAGLASAVRQLDLSSGNFPTSWLLKNITHYTSHATSQTLSYLSLEAHDTYGAPLTTCCALIAPPWAPTLPASASVPCGDAAFGLDAEVAADGGLTLRVARVYYGEGGAYVMTVFGNARVPFARVAEEGGCGVLGWAEGLVVNASSAIA